MTIKTDPQWLKDSFERSNPPKVDPNHWPVNVMTGNHEPPQVDWLINLLISFRASSCGDDEIYKHARSIHYLFMMLKIQGNRYEIKWQHKKGRRAIFSYTALRRSNNSPSIGASAQLTRLLRAANSKSEKRWIAAWVATPDKLRSRILSAAFPDSRLRHKQIQAKMLTTLVGGGYPSFKMLVPKSEVVLSAIDQEKKSLFDSPHQKRSLRQKNPEEVEVIAELAMIYQSTTGKAPTLTTYSGQRSAFHFSRFARLIGERYGLRLIDEYASRLRTRDRTKCASKPSSFNSIR